MSTKWSSEYYDRKEKSNMEQVKCWVLSGMVTLAIVGAGILIYYGHKLGVWLLGGC